MYSKICPTKLDLVGHIPKMGQKMTRDRWLLFWALVKISYFSLASGVHSSTVSLSSDGQLDDDGEKASSLLVDSRLALLLFALDDCTASAYDLFTGLVVFEYPGVVVTPTQWFSMEEWDDNGIRVTELDNVNGVDCSWFSLSDNELDEVHLTRVILKQTCQPRVYNNTLIALSLQSLLILLPPRYQPSWRWGIAGSGQKLGRNR